MSTTEYNWTHKKWCRPSDPINLIFEGISLDEVEKFLLNLGWQLVSRTAFNQVIPFPNLLTKTEQNRQLIKRIDKSSRRFHIRLWDVGDKIIAGIHVDAFKRLIHVPTDFESVEKFFAKICNKNSNWEVLEDSLDLDNRISGHELPYNNGKATVIRRRKD